jgi:hypothetical protein
MAKMTVRKNEDEVLLPMGQKKPVLHRYWLQVDRQTKGSYETFQDAETAARTIKSSHPLLLVGIYDAEKSQVTIV